MTPPVAVTRWHEILSARNAAGLHDLLADDVVFHSPVVYTPQVGKRITTMYLTAALHVFGNETFHYVREVIGAYDAVLEFEVTIDGIVVNGVDMLTWNDQQQLTSFKVMIRPLKAVNVVHERMKAALGA